MLEIIRVLMNNLDYGLCSVKNSSKTVSWSVRVLFCCRFGGWERLWAVSVSLGAG